MLSVEEMSVVSIGGSRVYDVDHNDVRMWRVHGRRNGATTEEVR